MIGLALLAGAILGLRFRIGLVLAATAAVFALGLGVRLHVDGGAAMALAGAALGASLTQVVAFLVQVLKAVLVSGAGARA
jgi:hypothetical protein